MKSKDEIKKEAFRKLRATVATKIAEQIASVQPMSGSAGTIFVPNMPIPKWTDWRRTTSIWPRRSINGKIIFGRINKRSRPDWRPIEGNQRRPHVREFATDKELFHRRLKDGKE